MTRSIFITGAAAGIGLATARRFAAEGWRVGMADVDEKALVSALCEPAGLISRHVCDVSDAASVKAALKAFAVLTGSGIDVVHNNAGILRTGHFEAIALAEQSRMVDINVRGVLNVAYAAFPYLAQMQNSVLLNMSSASALFGTPSLATYSASKFFVRGLTEALHVEWQRYGIRVCDLMPPFVSTGMVQGQQARSKLVERLGVKLTPELVAEEVWQLVHDDQGVHREVTESFRLLSRVTRPLPVAISLRMMKMLAGY